MRTCAYCGKSIVYKNAQARFCSDKCRNYERRRAARSAVPAQLTSKARWIRRTAAKVPLTVAGAPASSTDPTTWSSYSDAARSTVGAGLGFVLGDGIACIDLDHVIHNGSIDPRARQLLEQVEPFYVELSPSGDGIHAWVRDPSPTGQNRYTQPDGLRVEWYSADRYITVTGVSVNA